ncbi:MAG: polysaccharide biosynthesis protein, partial [Miltoncostaeaceae bacterium]
MLRPPWNIAALGHRLSQVLVDLGLVAAAYWLAYYVRFDGDTVPARYERAFAATVLIVIAVKMALFVAMRFYTKWWRFTSVRDLQAILLASVGGTVIITALFSIWRPDGVVAIPRGVLALDLALTIIMVGGARFVVRSIIERPAGGGRRAREVLICGAGEAGNVLLREMTRNRQLGLRPVGLIDDDPRKRRLRVQGARVRGTRADLARILRETPVDEVIIAMPSATGRVRNEIVEICRAADVPCRTLPGLDELITGGVRVSSLREVRVEDVLGRDPVETDFARVARYLNGRAVLVTGAGGSIGRELCRQIVTVGARRLIMVDHAENNLFEIDMELRSRGTGLPLLVPVIADCKDVALMERVFAEQRPDFVFHAAAYKHVPMMELNPVQAVGNNALATAGLADVAERHGVER